QNKRLRRPRNLPPQRFTSIVVVVRVGDEHGVDLESRWKVIADPDPARERVDEHLLTCRGRDTKTGKGDVFDVYRAAFAICFLSSASDSWPSYERQRHHEP